MQLINQARAQVQQMIGQYRNLMAGILSIKLSSATLPTPQSLESVMRDHQVNNFNALTQSFGNAYGAIPTSTDASQSDRNMSDMDDALTLDTLKTVKVSDNATDLELQAANSIETSASQAAPGSAPFLTASAVASSIRSSGADTKDAGRGIAARSGAHRAPATDFASGEQTSPPQLRGVLTNLLQHN